ncbi:hypothetical protein MHL31_02555 [Lutibacter sp. A80]|uniref:hypothetical protein n=1 Tax=Lutibacter sp. A80 TaxID=2918453 RepID=UPI001F06EFDF|nr:hypothetical protein [Lutibacter sp. A80]UMB61092.1 hypothetical protein MHL31_02555 [Lutibacter sp. A80]
MNRKITTLLLLAMFINFGYAQSEKINIKTDNLTEVNYLKMDNFYLTHYLYIDLFLRENLFLDVTPDEVSSILKAIKKYVSVENKLDIEIEKSGKRNYVIRFAILKKDDGTELLIAFTNWSVKKKLFEKEITIENDCYTRWYYLNGDKMTYRKDMSNKNDYSKMSKSDLANAYLFDELFENDNKVKKNIKQALKEKNLSVEDNITSNLILLKYYIFKREKDKTNSQIDYLKELFKTNNSQNNLKGLEMAFKTTLFQIELME